MADLNPAGVSAGTGKPGGYGFRGPVGTALPADEKTALVAAYKSIGLFSDEGLKRSISKAFESTRDWNGDEVARFKTETSVEIEFELLETLNPEALKVAFATSDVTVTPPSASAGTKVAIAYTGADPDPSVLVFEMKDGLKVRRFICPLAKNVTEDFEQTFKAGEAVKIPLKITLFKDGAGKFFYEYTDDGAPTGP